MDEHQVPSGIDTTEAHPARRYNYWLGGKDHYAADRASAEVVESGFPTVRLAAMENRRFLQRVVKYLVKEKGIHQFLDIGTGLPSAGNVHEVAQAITPESRVVYVDNDPIVLVHARALLRGTSEGAVAYLDADLREPEKILADEALRRTLNLSEPVALLMVATLHFIVEAEDPYSIVERLRAPLPSGSHLVITHATGDYLTPQEYEANEEANARSGVAFQVRSRAQLERFFTGLELLPPGITPVTEWHPDLPPEFRPPVEKVSMVCGVARIP